MNVQFLRDFQGIATRERFFLAGTVVDLDDGTAQAIIEEGAAEPVTVVEAAQVETTEVAPSKRAKGTK